MAYLAKFSLVFLIIVTVNSSKLNLPRVLLPLFKFSPTNFTLKVTDNGCYKWTLSRLDIIQVIPINFNKQYDCSSEVLLTTITKEFTKNTVIVFVEEISTKEILRCDIIVDVITSLNIITKTKQLFMEESPEIFEVRAYDDQGNEFSTLEGITFTWKINSGSRDVTGKNDVLRFINFKDSLYEIPKSIYNLDMQGLKGHLVLLEGIKTGTANVSVELSQFEYRNVPPTVVQLNVIANLIIEPSDAYILQGDVIYYKLLQVKNGRFIEVALPSTQYSLNIENDSIAQQFRPWVVEALSVGHTKLILSDVNSKMSNIDDATYLPSVTLNVVTPAYMSLFLLPHNNWITTLYQQNSIVVDLYDSNYHKIYIGPHPIVEINFDKRFDTIERSRNGSYVEGYAREIGTIHVEAEFNSVRTNDNVLMSFNRLTAEADILVYDVLLISPFEIFVPWDPMESLDLSFQLNVTGGDGFYQWNVVNTQVAVVTQTGSLKPRSIGHTEVTVSMQKNPVIQTSASVIVALPISLKIIHSSIESELGSPIYLAVALYYEVNGSSKQNLFTDCSGFPLKVKIDNRNFYYNTSSRIKIPEGACTIITVIGNNAGSAMVTVSYTSDEIFLKDTVKISAYEPLNIISPEIGKTVLSVGAQRYIVFQGGPSGRNNGRIIKTNYDDSTISVEEIHDITLDTERVYLVTCHTVGQSFMTLNIIDRSAFKDLHTQITYEIQIICANPRNIRLYTKNMKLEKQTCPPSFQSKNVVLNDKPAVLEIIITDDEGNIFDNATSLGIKWSLSKEDFGEISFPGIIKLQEEDHILYRLPLYHYQVIQPNKKTGNLDVTAKLLNYRKSWLKKLSINWEDKMFRIESDMQETISINLINSIQVSPESLSLYNHPKNTAKLYITYGSGYYKWTTSIENAARISYLEASRSLDIVPIQPGSFTLTITDECLNSEPILVNVHILTISKIEVDLISKIEKGKTQIAYLKLFDSEGNAVIEQNLLNLKIELDSKGLAVNCDYSENKRMDDRIVCLVSGLELGFTNLIFKAGTETSVVRSAPIRVQVYPPLQIIPRNITLIPGSSIQIIVKGGPQPDCIIEYSAENNVIDVDNIGNIIANDLGEGIVVAKAISVQADGEKIIYSTDSVRVNVVYLEGIRIKTPLFKIKTNAKMPIWVEGLPEQINPLVLASAQPALIFKWDVSSPNLAHVNNIFEETGIKILDTDKISMRMHGLKSGHVTISVKVIAPENVISINHKGIFVDSVNIEIFDDLKIINYSYQPVLLALNMKYRLKTNKDKIAHVSYKTLAVDATSNSVLEIDKNGLISTHNKYGFSFIQITSVEENGFIRNKIVPVQVSRVQYVMLNVIPELQVSSESTVSGLPKGIKLSFFVSYHDNEGNVFAATNKNVKFLQNNVDKIHISQNENDNNFLFDLLDSGTNAIKVYDDDSSIISDFVKINVVAYLQPDKAKFVIGDVICFNAPVIVKDDHTCIWNTSNENSLTVDKKTGFAIAKSKKNNIIVSYQCTNNLQMVTTVNVYSLQKIEIIRSNITNISNNRKLFIIPLLLINEVDDVNIRKSFFDSSQQKSCISEKNVFFYPYECELKFIQAENIDIDALFKVYPYYDQKYGHTCTIVSKDYILPITNQVETELQLKVTWNRYQSSVIKITFKPAINVRNKELTITDQDPVDIIQIIGTPSVLDNIEIITSNSKYIAILEENSDDKNVLKFSVYLKPAFLKESHQDQQKLSIHVVSEITGQNITIPINVNVNADQYVTPHHVTDLIMYYFNEYALKILVAVFISIVIYLAGIKLHKLIYEKRLDDSTFMDVSLNRSHSLSPSYSHKRPSYNEIQMIYGRNSEKLSHSRRN